MISWMGKSNRQVYRVLDRVDSGRSRPSIFVEYRYLIYISIGSISDLGGMKMIVLLDIFSSSVRGIGVFWTTDLGDDVNLSKWSLDSIGKYLWSQANLYSNRMILFYRNIYIYSLNRFIYSKKYYQNSRFYYIMELIFIMTLKKKWLLKSNPRN